MNILDYIFTGAVLLYALIGFATGTLRQLCGLLVIIVSAAGGYLFYNGGGNVLFVPIVIIVVVLTCKVAIYFISKIYFGLRSGERRISSLSRVIGGFIGGFRGVIVVYALLVCLYLFSGLLVKINPEMVDHIEYSLLYSYLKQYDLLPGAGTAKNIYFAGKLLNEDSAIRMSEKEDIVRRLRENPLFKDLLEDKEIQESIQNKDYKSLISDSRIIKLLGDREFLKELYSIDYEELYKNSIEKR